MSMFENIPNFWEYIAQLSLADVFRMLTGNLLTLIWILLIPYLLYKNPQGRELLAGLFDDAEAFTGVRASTLLVLFHALAVAIFFVPTAIFPEVTPEQVDKLRPVTGRHPYIAVFACTLPMLFYALIVFFLQFKRQRRWWTLALAAAYVVLAWFLVHTVMHGPRLTVTLVTLLTAGNMALCFGLILLIQWLNRRHKAAEKDSINIFWNYMAVGFCLALQLPLIASTLRQLEWLFVTELHLYNLNYLLTVGLTIAVVVFLSWARNLQYLSPTFILMGITIFYLLLGDAVLAAYLIWPAWAKYLLTAALVFILYVLLFRKSAMHNIVMAPSPVTAPQRIAPEAFFDAWWAANIEPTLADNPDGEIPVYLFGIQGGGSRAGFWICEVLNRLDEQSKGQFRKHLFAATSASGGSAGFGAQLALWRYLDEHPEIPAERKALIQKKFARGMFGQNFLSSAFFQLFIAEVGKRFLELFGQKVCDRNFTHQMDEALAFGQAIKEGWEAQAGNGHKGFFKMVMQRARSLFARGYTQLDAGPGGNIPNYPVRPYLSYWYADDGTPDGRLPLYFPITFNIQTGKPGFPSPVAWRPDIFIGAIDIIAAAEGDQSGNGAKQSVPLVGATHLSQLFPLMNAYTHIPGYGNFIDGGMFENQGLNLLSQLHEWLQHYISVGSFTSDEKVRARIRIKTVFVVNSAIEAQHPEPVKPISQLTAIARAVGFAGIGGRTTWWQQYFRLRLPRALRPVELVLQFPDNPKSETDQVPLGRWLSKRSMTMMEERVDALDVKEKWKPLVEELASVHA